MAAGERITTTIPATLRERYAGLRQSDKPDVCTAALIWYFNADSQTQSLYCSWARQLRAGGAAVAYPPSNLADEVNETTLLTKRAATRGSGVLRCKSCDTKTVGIVLKPGDIYVPLCPKCMIEISVVLEQFSAIAPEFARCMEKLNDALEVARGRAEREAKGSSRRKRASGRKAVGRGGRKP